MSLLWNMVNHMNDPTKTKLEQFKACIENLEVNDLEMLLQETKNTEYTKIVLEILEKRGHKDPTLV